MGGNTFCGRVPDETQPDHPRVGGEHVIATLAFMGYAGSSPRGRGTRLNDTLGKLNIRIIPAWAGNT